YGSGGVVAAREPVAAGGAAPAPAVAGPRRSADHRAIGQHALAGCAVGQVVYDRLARIEADVPQGSGRKPGLGLPRHLSDRVSADCPRELPVEGVELDAVFVALSGVRAHGDPGSSVLESAKVRLDALGLQGIQRQELGDLEHAAVLVGL